MNLGASFYIVFIFGFHERNRGHRFLASGPNAPVLLVKKKDNTYRVVVDYIYFYFYFCFCFYIWIKIVMNPEMKINSVPFPVEDLVVHIQLEIKINSVPFPVKELEIQMNLETKTNSVPLPVKELVVMLPTLHQEEKLECVIVPLGMIFICSNLSLLIIMLSLKRSKNIMIVCLAKK